MEYIVSLEHVNVFYDEYMALQDINMCVEKGDFLGIIGPNGGGKSTLLKTMLGILKPVSGKIEVNSNKIGYVPQSSQANRNFPITVFDTVLMARNVHHHLITQRYNEKDYQIVKEQLAFVGMSGCEQRHIKELSGGEFQKVLIARALSVQPEVLILDEPTANIDVKSREEIYHLLKVLNQKITIIMVTHDMMAISSDVKSLACLNRNLVYHGEPKLSEETVKELYGCPVDLIAHGVPHRVLGEHVHDEIHK